MSGNHRPLPILAVVVVCTLPHFFNVILWVAFVCLLLWGYCAGIAYRDWKKPARNVTRVLVVLLAALTFITHEGLSVEAFIALLALMISIRLLEDQERKDRMITVILCYFLIVAGLLFNDSIIATLYMLFAVFCTTTAMIHINLPQRGLLQASKLSATLLAQAAPVMLIMFLVFPRIQGGIWAKNPLSSARTGFSDEIAFGQVASLAQSSDVAFRVEFDKIIPPGNQLYWRAIVLWEFDGITWRRGKRRQWSPPSLDKTAQQVTYTITLEPHNQHWLVTLELPAELDVRRTWLLSDYSAYIWRPVTQRIAYKGTSLLTDASLSTTQSLARGLQLPAGGNPLARKLGEALKARAQSPEDIIGLGLDYFKENDFVYTTSPGTLVTPDFLKKNKSADLVDRFLFDSRRGFCEHFACSFAFLMRAAGIPARIIGGYQGGTTNRYGGYQIVRQSDAHAWCEVWLADRGWIRVDPTAAVAPQRILGATGENLLSEKNNRFWSLFKFQGLQELLEPLTAGWDLINSRWNRLVMGYSVNEQVNLYSRLGIRLQRRGDVPLRLGLFLVITLPLLLLIGYLISRRKKLSGDRTSACWLEFCDKLGRIDLGRSPSQGPWDYMNYLHKKRPDLDPEVHKIVRSYISLRYDNRIQDEELSRLEKLIKQFRPPRQPEL